MTMPLPIVPEQYPGAGSVCSMQSPIHRPTASLIPPLKWYGCRATSGMPTFASPLTRPTSAASKALKSAADHSLNGWRA